MKNNSNITSKNLLANQKGQSFLEFILIILMLTTISFAFRAGFNAYIGARWEKMLQLVAIPEHNNINVLNE